MSLIKFRNNSPIVDPFHNLLDEFFGHDFFERPAVAMRSKMPAANINETENGYEVQLAAPGMKKADFDISVNDQVLTIRSESKSEKEESKNKYSVREFNYSTFSRSFYLPESADAENISATYTDGILAVNIPKKQEVAQNNNRKIEVK